MSASAAPEFTVVIPAYNPGGFLVEALESVARQTARPAWVVVVDDGSSDGTDALAERLLMEHGLPGRVIRQANRGISAARNAGLAARRTDWVALLDADDLWLPTHLQRLRAAISAGPGDVVVAFGDSRFFGDRRSRTDRLAQVTARRLAAHHPQPGVLLLSERVFDELLPGLFIPVSASAFRLDVGQPEPCFDTGLHSGEDRYFFLQMSRRGRFVFVDEQTARTRRHERNTTHHDNAARLHQDLVTLLTKIDRSPDFALSGAQRTVVRGAARRAAGQLMYSSSCAGVVAYLRARQSAARYLPGLHRLALRDFFRAIAISLRIKKPTRSPAVMP